MLNSEHVGDTSLCTFAYTSGSIVCFCANQGMAIHFPLERRGFSGLVLLKNNKTSDAKL